MGVVEEMGGKATTQSGPIGIKDRSYKLCFNIEKPILAVLVRKRDREDQPPPPTSSAVPSGSAAPLTATAANGGRRWWSPTLKWRTTRVRVRITLMLSQYPFSYIC
ncbi:hypothetical protein L1987_14996 [Smallanthus sonchifolius]|uniref:Uncharacterized protein n=1 Tax=Smallanthus sonchifolius TaxID=185202 RepID=A0ACB9J4Q6_9ASTR|nr:hypothetical protein L1987_14996 [Smallanthus sonchifolius]